MTKRHFEQFAHEIKSLTDEVRTDWEDHQTSGAIFDHQKAETINAGAMFAAEMVCKVAAANDPRFDRARFMRACGLES